MYIMIFSEYKLFNLTAEREIIAKTEDTTNNENREMLFFFFLYTVIKGMLHVLLRISYINDYIDNGSIDVNVRLPSN